jgi:hypothetical protein
MSRIRISIFLIPFAAVFQALSGEVSHFRGFRFGDGVERVKKLEVASLDRVTPLSVLYRDVLFGFEMTVGYHFSPSNDGLVMGSYDITCAGAEIEEVLDHYALVCSVMEERHGRSLKDGLLWWNERTQYRNDLSNAFRFGDVGFRQEWYGEGVHVTLSLSNEINTRGEMVYRLVYQPWREYDFEEDASKL